MSKILNILFLCTGNSARSILAEVLMNDLGQGRIRAWSAGSQPVGQVNPLALKILQAHGHSTDGLSSKNWDVFAAPDAPQMDVVVTVCDNAAGEVCPVWPGHPIQVHWGFPDPAAAGGSEAQRLASFETVYDDLKRLLTKFAALPVDTISGDTLKQALQALAPN